MPRPKRADEKNAYILTTALSPWQWAIGHFPTKEGDYEAFENILAERLVRLSYAALSCRPPVMAESIGTGRAPTDRRMEENEQFLCVWVTLEHTMGYHGKSRTRRGGTCFTSRFSRKFSPSRMTTHFHVLCVVEAQCTAESELVARAEGLAMGSPVRWVQPSGNVCHSYLSRWPVAGVRPTGFAVSTRALDDKQLDAGFAGRSRVQCPFGSSANWWRRSRRRTGPRIDANRARRNDQKKKRISNDQRNKESLTPFL